jgi:hypothetical protein
MTNKAATNNGHVINSADARRRQIRVAQVIFAGAATIATLALFSAASPGNAETAVVAGSVPATAPVSPQSPQAAPSMVGGSVIAVDDTNPSSGDIFTQNAQDQSTA